MRIYIFTDMEGVAGIEEWDNRQDASCANLLKRRRHQRLLTAEINAAAAGAFDGGARDVIVKMGHADSILYENLDSRVSFIGGGTTWLQGLDEGFDAIFYVGGHSRAGTEDGVLDHSWSNVKMKAWFVNDMELGELGVMALIAGHYGIPYVFHAGDAAACREAEALTPGIVTAAVKKGYATHSALHLSKERARALIREKALQAMGKIGKIQPVAIAPRPASPRYVFRQVVRETDPLPCADDGCGTRSIAPDTYEYYSDCLLEALRLGTY